MTERISEYISMLGDTLNGLPKEEISELICTLEDAAKTGKNVFLFGNGGSAATASHLACDFQKGLGRELGRSLKAVSLNDCIPLMLAWANDADYSVIFEEQIKSLASEGDIAIGISGSGNSPNVLKGIEAANAKGLTTYGISGFGGGKLAGLAKKPIVIPSDNMQVVEDIHLIIGHIIYTCIRKAMGK